MKDVELDMTREDGGIYAVGMDELFEKLEYWYKIILRICEKKDITFYHFSQRHIDSIPETIKVMKWFYEHQID